MHRLLLVVITLVAILFVPPSATAQSAATPLTVSTVRGATHQSTSGWDVTLSSGINLFVPTRPFVDGGRAPAVGGTVSDFVDQGNFLGWRYGYATFTEGGTSYQGFRR